MGLGIGSATVDGLLYNQIALRPEINIGNVGVGLDLILYIDNEGNIRYDEWDIENDPGLLLDKILYIKYGQKYNEFHTLRFQLKSIFLCNHYWMEIQHWERGVRRFLERRIRFWTFGWRQPFFQNQNE